MKEPLKKMRWNDLNIIHLYEKNEVSPAADILIGGDFCPLRNYESRLLRGDRIFSDNLSRQFHLHDFTLVNLEAPLCAPASVWRTTISSTIAQRVFSRQ